jgi:HSP20 family protein
MSLIRREPFREIDELFNRVMGAPSLRWPRTPEGNGGRVFEWAPSADISETEREFLIRAELPAVKREDVRVMVENGLITIKGERKQEKTDKNEKQHRVERFYGSFERSFSLPDNVDVSAIQAESKDGVLTVHIPKTKADPPRAIEVAVQ